ncbi:hypothetical protein [Kitasatospora sp. CB01950]|uniref:hypothetical protein n=1 Tax=Kitasatospora sp. CB01950 TaxID=1703930 RepID=UPI00093BAE53|nr:hypothetical protein [Kitasatospora sp. CB01950]OKJ13638.1 hypothetical protein AMK19_09320 [Kitasatospora sp. CB01950]
MTTGSVLARSWRSFTGRPLSYVPPPPSGHGRDGHSLGRRVWASFTGAQLRPARGRTATPTPTPTPVVLPQPLPLPQRAAADRPRAVAVAPGWFALPRLPQAGGLAAAGGDSVLIEASSPDGSARFLVRGPGATGPDHRLELIVDTAGADRPLMTAVGYTGPDGIGRLLLVPVVRGRFGPPASYVRLPGFGAGSSLTASDAGPVGPASSWSPEQVAGSVRAALNEATREAWRQVGALLADDDLRAVIDRELG